MNKTNIKTVDDPPVRDTSTFEAKIITLFLPWLKDDISDHKWQVLSKNVGRIIREIQYGSK
jgi:hypothetical protein